VLSEVESVHQLMTDTNLEWVDVASEGEESSEGEGKEDTCKKKNENKLTSNSSLFIRTIDLLALCHGYDLTTYQNEDFQEIPQPPPEV